MEPPTQEAPMPGDAPLRIVTFFEQYGAGGAAIAARVAERLGVPFHGQAMSSAAMEQAEAEATAREENAFERILRSFAPLPSADPDVGWAMESRTDYELAQNNIRSVKDAVAGRGGVLVGRNATIILAHEPGALHVKIDGPVEQRLERAAAESGIDLDQARKRQRREDRVRVEISKRLFRWDPSDDAAYDLVVNTRGFTVDQAADVIVHAYLLRFPA